MFISVARAALDGVTPVQVAAYPTAMSVQAYFEQWVAFYQDYYQFPADLPVTFEYGFDSYKVTYCTLDAQLPGQARALPTLATGMVSVPRRSGPLSTVVYLHGTSVSLYDAVSNPNIAGAYNENGESFDGPPANAIFAGAGFITIAPDYLRQGDSTLSRHRYFHAQAVVFRGRDRKPTPSTARPIAREWRGSLATRCAGARLPQPFRRGDRVR